MYSQEELLEITEELNKWRPQRHSFTTVGPEFAVEAIGLVFYGADLTPPW